MIIRNHAYCKLWRNKTIPVSQAWVIYICPGYFIWLKKTGNAYCLVSRTHPSPEVRLSAGPLRLTRLLSSFVNRDSITLELARPWERWTGYSPGGVKRRSTRAFGPKKLSIYNQPFLCYIIQHCRGWHLMTVGRADCLQAAGSLLSYNRLPFTEHQY